MKQRQLGTTDLALSVVGFGAWAIGGGGWIEGWGPQDDDLSVAAIHRAWERGINWIDTAGAYGLGHSELVIARALKGMSERPYVFTKCTSAWDESGNIESKLKSESVRREVEGSLKRLDVDVLDVCQLHMPVPDEDIEEGWSTLAELRDEGKIRYVGVSNFDVPQMQRAHAIAPITSTQPIYNLLNREIERDVLPFCRKEAIGVVVYSPMASGLLTGGMSRERIESLPADDWRKRWPDFLSPRVDRTLTLVEELRPVADSRARSVAQLAIAWTLRDPVVTAATVGFRSAEQVDGLVEAANFNLEAKDLAHIEAVLPDETLFAMSMEGTISAEATPIV